MNYEAKQSNDMELKIVFGSVANSLIKNEEEIIAELNNFQGTKNDIKGYYLPDIGV